MNACTEPVSLDTRDLPAGWRVRTILALVENDEEKANPASVVMTREGLAEGETLHVLAERLLLELRDSPGLRVHDHRVSTDGTIELAYERVNQQGAIAQTTYFFETPEPGGGAAVTVVTTTCAKHEARAMLPVFAKVLERFRKRRASDVAPKKEEPPELADTWPAVPIPRVPVIPMPGLRRQR